MRRALLLTLLAALMAVPAALAHARLLRTVPRDGAVLDAAPREVHLYFDDTVRPLGGEAIRNGGGSVLAGRPHNPPGRPRELLEPLQAGLGRGAYTVRWRILSDDGHVETGVLAFAVGRGGAPPTAALSAGAGPSGWDVLQRWLLLVGIALAVGGSAVRAFVSAAARRSTAISALVLGGFVLAYLGLVSSLWFSRAEAATRFGRVSVAGAIVAFAGIVASTLALGRSRLWALPATTALALAAVPPVRGHPLDPGQPRWLNLGLDLAHLLVFAFWLGGALTVLLLRDRDAGRRFVFAAVALLPVLGGTGVARGFFELATPDQLWTTGYGRALLVKTGLALLALPLVWRALALAARGAPLATPLLGQGALLVGTAVAVAVLTDLAPGRVRARAQAPRPAPIPVLPAPPPRPPRGSLALGKQDGELAIGLAARPRGGRLGLEAQVIDDEGHGLRGLDVRFRVGDVAARGVPCRPGCYRADTPFGRHVVLVLSGPGRPRSTVPFTLPARWPPLPGGGLLRRATRAFASLPAVDFSERLASSPTAVVRSTWRLEAPDRLTYHIVRGASAVVIGDRRWDRLPGEPWVASDQQPLPQPTPPWGEGKLDDAYVLGEAILRGRRVLVLAFVDRDLPAWYRAYVEPRTARTLALDMTAAAHFMRDDYLRFGGPREIYPP